MQIKYLKSGCRAHKSQLSIGFLAGLIPLQYNLSLDTFSLDIALIFTFAKDTKTLLIRIAFELAPRYATPWTYKPELKQAVGLLLNRSRVKYSGSLSLGGDAP
jgi:hypothetical protein